MSGIKHGKRSLRNLNPSLFDAWLASYGYSDEEHFWDAISGHAGLAIGDQFEYYLTEHGYSESNFRDKLRRWLGHIVNDETITTHDMSEKFFTYFKALTFSKNYKYLPIGEVTASQLAANFSIGSPTATVTWSTTDSTRTYIDENGVIKTADTVNTLRSVGGYYDATGFHSARGVMVEAAGTNLAVNSIFDGTLGSLPTGWEENTGTFVVSDDIPSLYSGISTVGKLTGTEAEARFFRSITPSATKYTLSMIVSGSGTIKPWVSGGGLSDTYGSEITLSATPVKISLTFTTTTTDTLYYGARNPSGGVLTCYVQTIQLEAYPYPTSFVPTTTAAVTRNAETLKYAIAGNRTAATESIFIKFMPEYNFASSSTYGYLITNDTDERVIRDQDDSAFTRFYPNITDTSAVSRQSTTQALANTSYVVSGICSQDPISTIMYNGVSEASNVNAWTVPDFGTYFYLGSNTTGVRQINGLLQSIAIFGSNQTTNSLAIVNIINQ